MKKLRKILLVLILMLVVVPFNVKADEKVINIYLFYGDGCPHCAAEEEFLDEYLKDKDNVKLYKYEVWYDKTNQEYLQKVQKKAELICLIYYFFEVLVKTTKFSVTLAFGSAFFATSHNCANAA